MLLFPFYPFVIIFSCMGERETERVRMVKDQMEDRGIRDPEVLKAFRAVPRHYFMPNRQSFLAYGDHPVATWAGQTISQPYIVALMTELLNLGETPLKVLEVGTGSGYQSAILAYLGHHVVSIERLPELVEFAQENLSQLTFKGEITVVQGDGSLGYPEEAPYDRVIVTAGAPHVPEHLVEQLVIGGRLVIPCGSNYVQDLICIDRITETETRRTRSIGCTFVPLLGKDGF